MTDSVDALLGLPYPTHVRQPYNVVSVVVSTPPSTEALDLATAKLHLRVTDTAQDTLISAFISAARLHVEMVCQRALITQSWTVTYDRFDSPILLPGGNVQSITSLKYYDVNGTQQTMVAGTDYIADLASFPARVFAPAHADFPQTADQPATVSCVYQLGYGTAQSDIPAPIIAAMLLLIGDMYENRESNVPTRFFVENETFNRLLFPYKRVEP